MDDKNHLLISFITFRIYLHDQFIIKPEKPHKHKTKNKTKEKNKTNKHETTKTEEKWNKRDATKHRKTKPKNE